VLVDVRHRSGKSFQRLLAKKAFEFLSVLEQGKAELSISLVTDEEIQALNRTWRKKDAPTDVLSFSVGEGLDGAGHGRVLGDVVISLDTAKRQAKTLERTLREELVRYLAHGILHLLGHDHHKHQDAQKMAALENALLAAPGMISTR
jgi:probable rRNA maturation factor